MMALLKWEPNLEAKCELKDNREETWPGTGIYDVRNK